MTELGFSNAFLLGIVQGLTEFLPVSSSGHLALAQRWLDLDPDSPTMLLFDVCAHVGTLVAIMIVFAKPAGRFLRRLLRELGKARPKRRYALRIVGLCVAASVPTAAIGLGFKDKLEASFDNPTVIGICLIVTGVLLAATAFAPRARRGWGRFGVFRAAIVGFAQGLAILPGLSRSGATICMATLLGLRRRWAGEFSFLIATPAILGAAALKFRDTTMLPESALAAVPWGPVIVGAGVSFLVGVVALKLLLGIVRRAKLHYFAFYCWILAACVLLGAFAEK